jgi:anti-sigma B factor antagonist
MTQEPAEHLDTASPLSLELGGVDQDPVLTMTGEIDVATSPLLRAELTALLARDARRVTIDLAGVSFIDSSGLGVLVGALKRIREVNDDGAIRIVNPQPAVRKVFDITGLDALFDITD